MTRPVEQIVASDITPKRLTALLKPVEAFYGFWVNGSPTLLAGAIGPDGNASVSAAPSENRIAALLALGIWPFAQEGFAVSDVPTAHGEVEAAQKAMTKFLGRTA